MDKKHWVFDVDDTLTDARELNRQLFVETFIPYLDNLLPEQEKYLRRLHSRSRGTSMINQFAEAVKHLKAKIDANTLVERNEQLHIENDGGVNLFPGVKEFLNRIKKTGGELSVCTNRQKTSLVKILRKNRIDRVFKNIISCSDSGHEKPQPYCLEKLVEESHLKKKEFIYCGDSATDALFATNAGIDFVIVDQYINQKKYYLLMKNI